MKNSSAMNEGNNATAVERRVRATRAANCEERAAAGDNGDGFEQGEPALREGLKMCRYMGEQLSRELKKWQEKYDGTRQTHTRLKQNVVNLENEKQKIVLKFEEKCRQYELLNTQSVSTDNFPYAPRMRSS